MKTLSAIQAKPKPKSSADNCQDSVSNKSSDVSDETNKKNKQQVSLEVVVNNSEKLKAEIIWTLKTVYSVYSNTCYAMFPDSKIAKDVRLGFGKVKYVINLEQHQYSKTL